MAEFSDVAALETYVFSLGPKSGSTWLVCSLLSVAGVCLFFFGLNSPHSQLLAQTTATLAFKVTGPELLNDHPVEIRLETDTFAWPLGGGSKQIPVFTSHLEVADRRFRNQSMVVGVRYAGTIDWGTLELVAKHGNVEITSDPPGAEVIRDGKLLGKTPARVEAARPGILSFVLKEATLGEAAVEGEVKDAATTKLHHRFPRGNVEITSDPPGAEVTMDGQLLGKTPVKRTGIPLGPNCCHVSLLGWIPSLVWFDVQAEQTAKTNITLKPPGTVVAWGLNGAGQVNVPSGLGGVIGVAAGEHHTVALRQGGTVAAWGNNRYDQASVPTDLSVIVAVAAGYNHTVALRQGGTVVAWGRNGSGQATIPSDLSDVVAIAAGYHHTVALRQGGEVVAWGNNHYGQTKVPAGLGAVVAVVAGDHHSVALRKGGIVVAWGLSDEGQAKIPAALNGVVAIAAGREHTVALRQDGTVVAWGSNRYGQTDVPANLSHVVAIAAGGHHAVALRQDGTVAAWGLNSEGQINVPAGLNSVVAIAAGAYHTAALRSGR